MRKAGHLRAASPEDACGGNEPPNNLPAPLTFLIGREREIAAANELLQRSEVRLVTLTGPGGVGKTRLALRVAEDLLADFADGVFFVSLATISDPDLIVPTIARVLKLEESGARSLSEGMKEHLRDKRLLFVLDNFEHVVVAAPLLTGLLASAPRLKMLVTSRESLRVSGEHEYPIPPLELPESHAWTESLTKCAAVALFAERAHAVNPGFQIDEENASAVAEVCVRLDGLPLAIELAAARIKLLPPNEMLARLKEHRLRLLKSTARDLPPRQRTLWNAIEWSHDLLNEDERRIFRRLSVFAGPFALRAAEAIGGAFLDGLESLLDKSLVLQVEQDGEARLRMLRTIREYALEQLAASGEAKEVREKHAAYYLALAGNAEPGLARAGQAAWLDMLETEHDNLRAALRWSLEQGEDDIALRLAGAMWPFWLTRGHLSEGRRWLEEALAKGANTPDLVRARALVGAGILIHYQGDYIRAKELCEESLALYRHLNNERGVADSLHALAHVARYSVRYAEAQALYEESLAISRDLEDKWGIAHTLFYLGLTLLLQDDNEAARPRLEEALAVSRESGDRRNIAYSLGILGHVVCAKGEYAAAAALLEEALAIMRELGDRMGIARCLNLMGEVVLFGGRPKTARALQQESLTISRELGDRWHIAWSMEGLAATVAEKRPAQAAQLVGAAEALRDAVRIPVLSLVRNLHKHSITTARAKLGEQAFAAARAEGKTMPLERILAEDDPTDAPDYADLSARELQVLKLVAGGLSDAQVAEELFISPRTVNAHLRSIYGKLEVNSRAAATRYALDHGLV